VIDLRIERRHRKMVAGRCVRSIRRRLRLSAREALPSRSRSTTDPENDNFDYLYSTPLASDGPYVASPRATDGPGTTDYAARKPARRLDLARIAKTTSARGIHKLK